MILTLLLAAAAVAAVEAQRLVIGERAPELRIREWMGGSGLTEGRPSLVEFVVSTSAPSVRRVAPLKALAARYRGRLDVVLVAKEAPDKIAPLVGDRGALLVGIDDGGKSYAAFGVQYVPFAVLIDGRGRVVWSGNPSSLDEQQIDDVL